MKSFHPEKRLLLGPGPSDVHPRILEAMARPTLGHLDPDFQGLMEEIKSEWMNDEIEEETKMNRIKERQSQDEMKIQGLS